MLTSEQIFDPTNPSQFVIVILVGWMGVSYILSMLGGWARLAEYYLADSKIDGEQWRFQSASMRFGISYNNCLTVGANSTGLLLAVLFIFRLGHPPLFIPWSDIRKDGNPGRFLGQRLVISKAPSVTFRIRESLVEKIEVARGQKIEHVA